MIFMHVTPQCVAAWDKFLTILTIVTGGHMLALDVFIQMSLVYGCVIAVGTHPRSLSFQYFGLYQLVHLLFGCKKKYTSRYHRVYWLFRQWMIPPDMGPQGIPWWAEFLTILTIVTRRHMFGLNMLIKMGLCSSQVATVSAGPWAIYFCHFGLNQSLKISCNMISTTWNVNSFLERGGFVIRGSSRHFWTDNVYRNAYMCNLDCQHAYSQRVQTFPACPLQCNHSQHISKTGLYQQSFPSTSSSQRRLKIRVIACISNCAVG